MDLKLSNQILDTVILEYRVLEAVRLYKRYPETIPMGLSKIGGLYALLKIIFNLVHFVNRILFERELANRSLTEDQVATANSRDDDIGCL